MTGDIVWVSVVVVVLVVAALAILSTNEGWQRQHAELPPTVLYDGAAGGPLVAHAHRLSGHPALVERTANGSISVIVERSGPFAAVATPREVLRLAAEALVAEEALGVTVARGILRHPERDLALPITPALRALALRQLADLRASEGQGPRLTHQDATICHACAYRAMCAIGRLNGMHSHSA